MLNASPAIAYRFFGFTYYYAGKAYLGLAEHV